MSKTGEVKCDWCNNYNYKTIGHSGVSFPKSCRNCGHQDGEHWEWKELRERFDAMEGALRVIADNNLRSHFNRKSAIELSLIALETLQGK